MIQEWIRHSTQTAPRGGVILLVDGAGTGPDHADHLFAIAKDIGSVTVRRVYGDISCVAAWGADPRFTAVDTGQDPRSTAAEISLVIDALDLAHSGRASAFVIVSPDGDLAPLAGRLREAGFPVTGVGKSNSAKAFREACLAFHLLPDGTAPQAAITPQPAPLTIRGRVSI